MGTWIGFLLQAPCQESSLQTGHVPWCRIKQETSWFMGHAQPLIHTSKMNILPYSPWPGIKLQPGYVSSLESNHQLLCPFFGGNSNFWNRRSNGYCGGLEIEAVIGSHAHLEFVQAWVFSPISESVKDFYIFNIQYTFLQLYTCLFST